MYFGQVSIFAEQACGSIASTPSLFKTGWPEKWMQILPDTHSTPANKTYSGLKYSLSLSLSLCLLPISIFTGVEYNLS